MQVEFVRDDSWGSLFPDERVRVYKNLHRNCYSILRKYYDPDKKKYSWLVWNYLFEMTLLDPKFVVREGGRRRVIKEQKKNVHAFIEGTLSDEKPPKFSATTNPRLKYDPYKSGHFHLLGWPDMDANDHHFSYVHLSEDGVYI